ncbi:hypothetical protein AAVH_05966, partial [Aphelenchoides avenae]
MSFIARMMQVEIICALFLGIFPFGILFYFLSAFFVYLQIFSHIAIAANRYSVIADPIRHVM